MPLPGLERSVDRVLVRLVAVLAAAHVHHLEGSERLLPTADPFLLACNHSSRRETLILTALLLLLRGGKPVHFLADWNFRLIPGVGYLYDRSGAITVARKPARPAILNALRSRYASSVTPYQQARQRLETGSSVGVFPEGRVNPRADALLPGRWGAARLAISAGVPVVPLGIRCARSRDHGRLVDPRSPLEIHVGAPLAPPRPGAEPERDLAARFRAEIMETIAPLCGKAPPTGSHASRVTSGL